jgi:hypothetical protein
MTFDHCDKRYNSFLDFINPEGLDTVKNKKAKALESILKNIEGTTTVCNNSVVMGNGRYPFFINSSIFNSSCVNNNNTCKFNVSDNYQGQGLINTKRHETTYDLTKRISLD